MYGDIDWMDPTTTRKLIEMKEINGSIHILEDADHNLFIDNPKGLNKLLVNELKSSVSD